jgi:hypothetical protein
MHMHIRVYVWYVAVEKQLRAQMWLIDEDGLERDKNEYRNSFVF